MGFLDKMTSAITGVNDETNAANKQKMRELFNSVVKDGDSYKVIATYGQKINPLIKRTTYYSYIVGYKGEGELVIVPCNSELTDASNPIAVTPANCTVKKSLTGETVFTSDVFEKGKVSMIASAGPVAKGYVIMVIQGPEEISALDQFIKTYYKK